MFEQILDKIDEWDNRLYDWQRTSFSRSVLGFLLHIILILPIAFIILAIIGGGGIFCCWIIYSMLGL
jgi:hypothetical protein